MSKWRQAELRESADVRPAKLSSSKENRHIQTAEQRNHSSEYMAPLALKNREFSSTKNPRKEAKHVEIELHPLRATHEAKEKRHNSAKNFIGIKLKTKLQRYLLFLALVNYSLRVGYSRSEAKRYKVFVGKGNNSKLVKGLFANRFWWELTQDESEAHLVWTQKSKKRVFKTIGEASPQKRTSEPPCVDNPRKKTRSKRKQAKRSFCEQFQGILCEKDRQVIRSECKRDNFQEDLKAFLRRNKQEKRKAIKVTHNHIEHHRLLTNKKNLFHNMKQFCEDQKDDLFNYVPLTFHIRNSSEEEYQEITRYEEGEGRGKDRMLWIVKPGENSNRGCGIEVCRKVQQVRKHIEKERVKHPERTFIVQKYISPFLFHRRKFDIRCFVLVTSTPLVSAYFYPSGYIRTSSYEFSLKNCSNKYIHLTNDAIQKKGSEYSKYEHGNKVTFQAFQKYLEQFQPNRNVNFFTDILPAMRQLVTLSIRASNNFRNSSKEHTFQILGYDFMIDEQLQPWLIEVNTNPCLETSCPILSDIIPCMLQNCMKISIDPVFKPPRMEDWSLNELLGCSQRLLQGNRFQLLYSQLHE